MPAVTSSALDSNLYHEAEMEGTEDDGALSEGEEWKGAASDEIDEGAAAEAELPAAAEEALEEEGGLEDDSHGGDTPSWLYEASEMLSESNKVARTRLLPHCHAALSESQSNRSRLLSN